MVMANGDVPKKEDHGALRAKFISNTDLVLKEAKDLVEKAPAVLKKGVIKEEAEKIVEKMKLVGAKVVME
ncbi:hypothetical protein KSP40_PGU003274 [Platanthera guangdongensis]|uniref:Large ribosomal subunit protein bL12 C-terminal domain-containing protein n=1 Tax=Platanthera guangdongensis TaxID=2320717 RepID=A0ABR2LKI8_9ASPA